MRRIPRVTLSAVAGFLAVSGFTACGDDSSPSSSNVSAATLVAAAPQKTADAGTARMAIKVVTAAAGQSYEMTGEGLFDFQRTRGRLSFEIPQLGAGSADELLVGDQLYMQIPGVSPPGKWLGVDLSELSGNSALGQFGNADPSAGLQVLRGASSDVHESGEATLRGEPTTKYSGTIETAKVLENVPKGVRAKVETLLAGVPHFPFDAYLDDEGRLRQLDQTITLPASAQTQGQQVDIRSIFELYDFGVAVNVKAPPASEVADGSRLIDRLGSGAR